MTRHTQQVPKAPTLDLDMSVGMGILIVAGEVLVATGVARREPSL